MSFSTFYLVQLSNAQYMEHTMRSPPPATEGRKILPYHVKRFSPCKHNLPTPCPPSTPIQIQLTNWGQNQYVQVHQGLADNLLQELHSDLLYRAAIDILNSLNNSPTVEAISPIKGSRNDHSFYICQLCYPTLVTQPMLQLRPNCTPLRSMDYYHQIFCRFQKCKRKLPPPALPCNDFEKSWFFFKNFSNVFFFFANKNFSTV